MSARGAVLVVDDDPSIGFSLTALLEDEGWEVVVAESLASARLALAREFSIAILDRHLADGNGTSLIPEIRSGYPATRIVMMTGEDGFACDAADAVLRKADHPDVLFALLDRFASERVPEFVGSRAG